MVGLNRQSGKGIGMFLRDITAEIMRSVDKREAWALEAALVPHSQSVGHVVLLRGNFRNVLILTTQLIANRPIQKDS